MGRFLVAKSLNIAVRAQKSVQNFGLRALSGASAENALCIRLNDKGADAPPIKIL